MSTTSTGRLAPPSTNGSRSLSGVPSGAASSRRSAPMALVGLAAVVIGALVFLGAHLSLDRREAVLVVARPVASGQVIAAEDLRLAKVSLPSGTASVPASGRSQVVGKTAAVGLVAGGVLAPGQVGAASGLEAGQAVVAVAVKAGQAPSGLRPGTRVQVVDTAAASSADGAGPAVVSTLAVVSDVATSQSGSGVSVVSLRVPLSDAVAVAAAGAAGRVSLVVVPSS